MEKKDVIAFFDRCAASWDADMIKSDVKIGKILDNAEVGAGMDVLDVACGTGVMFDYYLQRGVASVTGIDIAPEMAKIAEQIREAGITEPKNLEEQAISLVGTDIYEKLIKGYTQKQWGRACTELPSFIIKRLPVRLTFDNNYFNALYQGIPMGGYTKMVENMLEGIEVRLGEDYLEKKAEYDGMADKVIYTGAIDAYFDYQLGTLEYRSVRFETEVLDMPNLIAE